MERNLCEFETERGIRATRLVANLLSAALQAQAWPCEPSRDDHAMRNIENRNIPADQHTNYVTMSVMTLQGTGVLNSLQRHQLPRYKVAELKMYYMYDV
jgi:hypothetical protein